MRRAQFSRFLSGGGAAVRAQLDPTLQASSLKSIDVLLAPRFAPATQQGTPWLPTAAELPLDVDPSPRQKMTPLLGAVRNVGRDGRIPFHMPGHKRGVGMSAEFRETFGSEFLKYDLTELPTLDNLQICDGVLGEAEQLAAEAWGAARSFFLVNGSTVGICAAIWATTSPGDKYLLQRNSHKAGVSGLIISGATPVYLRSEFSEELQMPISVTPEQVHSALQQHDVVAVSITRPTYEGDCADVEEIAKICHARGVPLIVDEAHGAHLNFAPGLLPASALKCGADIVIQSVHKTLGAMTQASLLHVGHGALVDQERIKACLNILQSSSPSYVLMSSVDSARSAAAQNGGEAIARVARLARSARERVAEIPGLSVFGSNMAKQDPTRLTVVVSGLGVSGRAVKNELYDKYWIAAEHAGPRSVSFTISIGNTQNDVDALIDALQELAASKRSLAQPWITEVPLPDLAPTTVPEINLREVFNAPKQAVPLASSVGMIAAEVVCPYPPGIPVLMPGERITPEAVAYLQHVKDLNLSVCAADCSLNTVRVLR